jgi:hypothetical protein
MARNKPMPPRITVNTGLNSAFVDEYWTQIEGLTEEIWMNYTPAKRYESTLNHLAAQATLAKKLAEKDEGK